MGMGARTVDILNAEASLKIEGNQMTQEAVSYTHLDVYKRQIYDDARAKNFMRFPCGHEEAPSTKPPSYATLNWYALQNQNNKCKGRDIRYHMKHLKHILSGLILTFFLISFSVMAVLNFRPLYYFDIGHLNISQTSGYSEEEIRENYDAPVSYTHLDVYKRQGSECL